MVSKTMAMFPSAASRAMRGLKMPTVLPPPVPA